MKKVLFTVLFFILFYFEHKIIGGVKLTIIWKIPVLIFLIVSVFEEQINSDIIWLGYLVSIKNIITVNALGNFMSQFTELSYFIILPLIIHFLISNKKISITQLRRFLFLLANVIIITNIPIFLKIVEPAGSLSLGYFEVNLNSFYGLFDPHSTSVYLALSIIIMLYFLIYTSYKFSKWKYVYYLILLIGAFMLLKTFIRTGWLMFLVGILVLYVGRLNFFNIKKVVAFLIIGLSLISVLYYSNDSFRDRLIDNRANQVNAALTEKVGSGRIEIWGSYLKIWKESNFLGKIIGISNNTAQEIFGKTHEAALFAHNEFVNMFVSNGVLGLVLLLLYIKSIYKSLHNHILEKERKLFMAIFFMWMVCMFFQQANYFLQNVILGILISISIYTESYTKLLKPTCQ
jgi:hypothetical protein